MIRVLSVVGTRPNFIKIGALHHAFSAHPAITPRLVHTGQHYDAKMSEVFFDQLELPEPDQYLGIGSGSHAAQTAATMIALETVFLDEHPDVIVVVGDVNSTLAGALVAAKLHLPLVHVEAGLRSFDRQMPEEINRLVTDAVADVLYVTEQSGLDNLRREGVPDAKVSFVGNVMIDSLLRFRPKAAALKTAAGFGLTPKQYVLMTMHRPVNVDDPANLRRLVEIVQAIAAHAPVVFPVHPRTRNRMAAEGHLDALNALDRLHLAEPIGYLEFLSLMMDAGLLVTDSGGIQEETTSLGVPCVTLRDSTERPITITLGTNMLLPLAVDPLVEAVQHALSGRWKQGQTPPFWDGHAAERIAADLVKRFHET
jgi:UDP-N-acetylglucosamine 2-epimerase (non-hydrolysing)